MLILELTGTINYSGFGLSCSPTVTVLVRTISKDLTEVGLRNFINTFNGNILHLRFQERRRGNFNQAAIIVGSMREARLLLDWLEKNQIFPNLSPVIVREEESDTTESDFDVESF